MAKTVVFFNLADMHENGLAKTSVDSLRRKYPSYSFIYELWAGKNQIYQIDLFGLLSDDPKPKSGVEPIPLNMLTPHMWSLPAVAREEFAISMLCLKADKIMLGIHGTHDDTEQGFAGMGWDAGHGPVGNVGQFARLINKFLYSRKHYKMSLIMCFGARSQNYRVNHEGVLSEEDIKSSFAYKFFKLVGARGNVTLTARTGSVAFNTETGRSEVQTEAAVNAEIDDHEIQHARETEVVSEAYELLQNRLRVTKEGNTAFLEMEERMRSPTAVPRTAEERIIRSQLEIRFRINALKAASNKMVSKYGKFIYTYNAGTSTATVCRKYEDGQKVMRVLYRGPL